MRSPAQKLGFIHVPRTGGTSVIAAVKHYWPDHVGSDYRSNAIWRDHQTAFDTSLRISDWAVYYSFAFVRNPWDRMVSLWSRTTMQRMSFNDFVHQRGHGGPMQHFMQSQTDFLFDHGETPLVNTIGRFEHLEADFAQISVLWGGEGVPIGKLNASEHEPYQTYYTPELRQLVAERYAVDIANFGYRF